jgi:hypothetical protein
MKFTAALAQVLKDPLFEAVRRNIDQRIRELQALVCADIRVIRDVELPNPSVVFVPHGLGRAPRAVILSVPRAPDGTGVLVGLVEEVRGTVGGKPVDSTKVIALVTGAFGTTVTIDVVVF